MLKGRDPQFKYVSDFDFWLRAGLLGPFARIPKTLATFRVHPDSASIKQQGLLMAEEHIILLNKFFSLPLLPTYLKKYKSEAYCYAYLVAKATAGSNPILGLRFLITAFLIYPVLFLKKIISKLRPA